MLGRLEAEVQVLRQSDEQQKQQQQQQQQNTSPQPLRRVITADAPPPAATFERTRRIAERRPPTSLVLSLVSLYFRHVSPWFPFLDPPRVFSDIGSVQDPSLLHYALFGISLPFSYDIRLNQASSDSFWKYSKRRIFIEALEEPSYSALEALTILTLDISGITNGPQVWGALAVAVKLAVQLSTSGPRVFRTSVTAPVEYRTLTAADKTCRQRLFWAIYALDCYVSVTAGQVSDLAEEQVQAFLSLRHSTWRDHARDAEGGITPLYVFSYQLELMDLVRRLHQVYLEYTTGSLAVDETAAWLWKFSSCLAEMAQWIVALPSSISLQHPEGIRVLPRSVVPSILMLHAFFHGMMIQLHGVIAYPPDQNLASHASQLPTDSRQQCLESAAVVIRIATDVATDDIGDRLGWPFAWSLWVAARYLLVAELNGAETSRHHFDALLGSLKQMSQYWQISGKYWRLLNQAVGDLHNARRDANDRNGVLGLLADLRVSTSDLEDQFRTDPVLHSALSSGGHVASPRNNIEASEEQGDAGTSFPCEETPYLDGPAPVAFDNWFSMPLFAASASQYYPIPATFSDTENGGPFDRF
ncbi:hypothetical protein NEMBOFW57_008070 [Staphylotrichum longicolle]|uniref:Xylanolytic transcriptional activator regulatory domain-containing protein n=1 Tax=Staphylotrichum longicolle TaxID=669026 RepID=A0AAD4EQL8_9PEZI|nr:hypothetical protein NEMBOFW57_008070 [Staphylotrichum longicolle]